MKLFTFQVLVFDTVTRIEKPVSVQATDSSDAAFAAEKIKKSYVYAGQMSYNPYQ